VITDSDLLPGVDEASVPGKAQPASGKPRVRNVVATNAPDSRAADQWRKQILVQKRTVETLEKRLARFQASLSTVDADAISRGEIFNRNQALQHERIAQVQEQLGEQRARLLEMQEEARRAGMHTQVYDP
jgi:diphthamide synthase (EF-2-diphthine--ammonia ligase)